MIKISLIDFPSFKQYQDQDSQVIIAALVEELADKETALNGALQRIKGLEAIKGIYLNTINTLMEAAKEQEVQIRELKQNSRAAKYFEIEAENLKLAQEVARLKGVIDEQRKNHLPLS